MLKNGDYDGAFKARDYYRHAGGKPDCLEVVFFVHCRVVRCGGGVVHCVFLVLVFDVVLELCLVFNFLYRKWILYLK